MTTKLSYTSVGSLTRAGTRQVSQARPRGGAATGSGPDPPPQRRGDRGGPDHRRTRTARGVTTGPPDCFASTRHCTGVRVACQTYRTGDPARPRHPPPTTSPAHAQRRGPSRRTAQQETGASGDAGRRENARPMEGTEPEEGQRNQSEPGHGTSKERSMQSCSGARRASSRCMK